MRPPSRFVLALLLALGLGTLAWLAFSGSRASPSVVATETATASPARDDLPAPDQPALRSPAEVAPQSEPSAAEPAAVASQAPAPPEPIAIRLHGVVRPAEGRATLEEAQAVRVVDGAARAVRVDVGALGEYSVPGLAPGRYWVEAGSTRDGHASATVELDGTQREQRLDLQLVLPPEILVRVVDPSGAPIGGYDLLAVATREAPGDWLDEIQGSYNNPFGVGHFWQSGFGGSELPEGFLGRIKLDVAPPVFVSLVNYQRVVATERVEQGETEVEFVLPKDSTLLQPARLRFRPVDARTGVALPSPRAEIAGAGMRLVPAKAGAFDVPGLAPGLYELRVRANGYERLERPLRLEAGSDTDLGDLPLELELWISGTLVGPDGAGLSAQLTCTRVDPQTGEPRRTAAIYTHQSASDGSFRIGGLSRDVYALRVLGAGGSSAATTTVVDTTHGPVDGLRVELVAGVPLVLTASDQRWREVRFRVLDAQEKLAHSSRLWSAAPQSVLLPPGDYTLEVTCGADLPRKIPVSLAREPVSLAVP